MDDGGGPTQSTTQAGQDSSCAGGHHALCLQSRRGRRGHRGSVLPLLPGLHAAFQGGDAVGVPVGGGHGAILVVFPPGGPLLVVGLKRRADTPERTAQSAPPRVWLPSGNSALWARDSE